MSVALLPPQLPISRQERYLRSQTTTNSVTMTRSMLSETIQVSDNAVPRECWDILFICLTSVQQVWAHVTSLPSTSIHNSLAKDHPRLQQIL